MIFLGCCFYMSDYFLFSPSVDSEEKQVQLITTLDNTEVDLLTLEYIKVCATPHD